MSDSLTNSLVDRTRCSVPFVIKYVYSISIFLEPTLTQSGIRYVPYGALTEVSTFQLLVFITILLKLNCLPFR